MCELANKYHNLIHKNTVIFWASVSIILMFSIANQTFPEKKDFFYADTSSHIMMVMSLSHDFDLKYTLDDLNRFKNVFSATKGPAGIFLKIGKNDNIYFAKPFLYALTVSPFYGIWGFKSFLFVNVLCFFVIGLISTIILKEHFGDNIANILCFFMIVLSPFTAWLSVPHPDLFISALLLISGFIMLKKNASNVLVLIGCFILGMLIYEKPTFFVTAPFLFFLIQKKTYKLKLLYLLFLFIGWFIPTLVNLLQDGNFFSYQGLRFYVAASPFPLENGWIKPVGPGLTSHIFNVKVLVCSFINNILLLPEKFFDFFLGRQTGIILYFPVAFMLLIFTVFSGGIKSYFLLLGFFSYLILNWMAFPANGYGGSGSYGSRYLMQILPLIILSFSINPVYSTEKMKENKVFLYSLIVLSVTLSIIFQYKVLPPTDKLVKNPGNFLNSFPAVYFPLEKSLLPSLQNVMKTEFVTKYRNDEKNFIYRFKGFSFDDKYFIKLDSKLKYAEIILYQFDEIDMPPPIEIISSKEINLKLYKGKNIIHSVQLKSGIPFTLQLNKDFYSASYFDILLKKKIRWNSLKLEFATSEDIENFKNDWATVSFKTEQNNFNAFGRYIKPSDFEDCGLKTNFFWSHLEAWGIWSDGNYSDLLIKFKHPISFNINMDMHAYTPQEYPRQSVDLLINGKILQRLLFTQDDSYKNISITVSKEDFRLNGYVNIGFKINNPVSPRKLGISRDGRNLGVGLHGLKIEKIS